MSARGASARGTQLGEELAHRAALRMLMNNPIQIRRAPEDLVVYGGIARRATGNVSIRSSPP